MQTQEDGHLQKLEHVIRELDAKIRELEAGIGECRHIAMMAALSGANLDMAPVNAAEGAVRFLRFVLEQWRAQLDQARQANGGLLH